jgi:hypothetical protein
MSALPKEISPESKCPRRRRISPIPDFPDDPHAPIVVASSISVGAPMAEVFLSYSQKDRTAVERIAGQLRALGLSVWYDARLESGDSFDAVIAAELRQCNAVLACWSPDAISSKWVRSEALFGYDKHKLAASFLNSCELTPPFNLVHAIDLTTWKGEPAHVGWLSIARTLSKMCERPGVGVLAEAMATGSPESLKSWAQHFPDEPLAKEMWASRESSLRMEFAAELEGARTRLSQAVQRYRADAESRFAGCIAGFEKWLDAEKHGSAGVRPKPGAVIDSLLDLKSATDPGLSVADVHLRKENERLKIELDRVNSRIESLLAPIETQEPSRIPNNTRPDVGRTLNRANASTRDLLKNDMQNGAFILMALLILLMVGFIVYTAIAAINTGHR